MVLAQRVGRFIDAVDEQHCRADFGISAADMRVLFALRRSGPTYALRPTELFRSLLVTSGAITKQIDRLEKSGHVDRQPGPDRSGGLLVHLTEKGFRVADEALTSLANSSVVSQSTLTIEERDTLSKLLGKMLIDLGKKLKPALDLGDE